MLVLEIREKNTRQHATHIRKPALVRDDFLLFGVVLPRFSFSYKKMRFEDIEKEEREANANE